MAELIDMQQEISWLPLDSNGLYPPTRYGSGSFLYKGHIWLVCGEGVGKSSEVWKYSLVDSKWSQVIVAGGDNPPSCRDGQSISYIGNGRVLLFGGQGTVTYRHISAILILCYC